MDWLTPTFYSQAYSRFISKKWHETPLPSDLDIVDLERSNVLRDTNPDLYIRLFGNLHIEETLEFLIGEINTFFDDLRSIATWKEIIESYEDESQRYHLIVEFVEPLAYRALSSPQALKDRFIFIGTQIGIFLEKGRAGAIPENHKIKREHLSQWVKNWDGFSEFSAALEGLDGPDYRTNTNLFRNRLHHQIPISIEIGYTPLYEYKKEGRSFRLGLRKTEPIKLQVIITEATTQLREAHRCLDSFIELLKRKLKAGGSRNSGERSAPTSA